MPAAPKPPPEEAEEVDEILVMLLEVPKPLRPTAEQPPSQDGLPPPYDSAAFPSLHAQSSRLLAGWQPSQKPPEERFPSATNNRNPRVANAGFRRCTRHVTLRNLLIALVLLLVLLVSVAFLLYFLGVLQIAETSFFIRFGSPSTITSTTIPSTVPTTISSTVASTTSSRAPKRATIPLMLERRTLGTFIGKFEQMLVFGTAHTIILSQYYPEEQQLKSAKLVASNHRKGFTYELHRTEAGYTTCSRDAVEYFCCKATGNPVCFDIDKGNTPVERVPNTSATQLQSRNGLVNTLTHYPEQHAVFDTGLGKMIRMEDNRLPPSSVSLDISFTTWTLNELVRIQDDFKICEYKRVYDSDYGLELVKPCRSTPFNVDHELQQIDFCTKSTFTAVVQYGHRG
ncbi:hypothetical protein M3Y99_01651300 [Aphelenchoides fujianensis]|nr:hypothetical protein M3Y99_01651300 [Aphelenchoides fujianensis]